MTSEIRRIYFLGIAGLLMSSLACIAKRLGFSVTGSDESAYPPTTTILGENDIPWIDGHNPKSLGTPDLIVLGNHVRRNNAELQEALRRQIPIVSFPEFVHQLFARCDQRIVVAGTHGKSTTTAMIGCILDAAGCNPTVLVGAVPRNLGASFQLGDSGILVIEGDEYTSSCLDRTPKFMYYDPTLATITNAELDHVDICATLGDQLGVFRRFAESVDSKGTLVVGSQSLATLLQEDTDFRANLETFGNEGENDWQATDIAVSHGEIHFKVLKRSILHGEFALQIPGRHNVQNAVAAIALCATLGIPVDAVKRGLLSFRGVEKRFEVLASPNGITVVEDYAHHPTAIKATLQAAREWYPGRRLWCIYEPHTYSRTKRLLQDFADALRDADEVIVGDIFAARETELEGQVHASEIVHAMGRDRTGSRYISDVPGILSFIKGKLRKGDVLLVMSIRRFGGLAEKIAEQLEQTEGL